MGTKIIRAGRIDDAEGSEISYVDHPANSKSEITGVTIAKRDLGQEIDDALETADVTPEQASGIKKLFSWLFSKKEESTSSINDLPDSAFAYIEPGGKKDGDGKTTPRSKRHLPIHDAAHVRNALARLNQTQISAEAKAKAHRKIVAAAKRFGVEVSGDDKKVATLHDIRKGLYDVGNLAEVVQRLDYLAQCAEAENEYEGDDSDVPAKLSAARDALGQILCEMVDEEVAELNQRKSNGGAMAVAA